MSYRRNQLSSPECKFKANLTMTPHCMLALAPEAAWGLQQMGKTLLALTSPLAMTGLPANAKHPLGMS